MTTPIAPDSPIPLLDDLVKLDTCQLREAARLVDHWFGTWSAATPPGNSVTLPA
jgi:hypothetical protein